MKLVKVRNIFVLKDEVGRSRVFAKFVLTVVSPEMLRINSIFKIKIYFLNNFVLKEGVGRSSFFVKFVLMVVSPEMLRINSIFKIKIYFLNILTLLLRSPPHVPSHCFIKSLLLKICMPFLVLSSHENSHSLQSDPVWSKSDSERPLLHCFEIQFRP
jgi:hypothetical protein